MWHATLKWGAQRVRMKRPIIESVCKKMVDRHRPQNLTKHGKETLLEGDGEMSLHISYIDWISLTARMTVHVPPISPSTGSNRTDTQYIASESFSLNISISTLDPELVH